MESLELLNKIIRLPIVFGEVGNKSIYALLQESGYFIEYDKIQENDIIKYLEKKPEYIDVWINWSDDQRSTDSWYFLDGDNENYEVCIIDSNYKKKECMKFSDKIKACAAYIKRELEFIRLI